MASRRPRDADATRAAILDAAEALFAERGPDAAGLRDAARAAGVSHGLIRHHFGSYDGLVEAVMARRAARISSAVVARIVDAGADARLPDLLREVLGLLGQPAHARLAAWAMLSGRAQQADFFAARQQGLRLVVDALVARRAADGETADPSRRRRLEDGVLVALSALYGFALGKPGFLAALGRAPAPDDDARFAAALGAMLEGWADG